MGLFDFAKGIGTKLFGDKDEPVTQAEKIRDHIASNLSIDTDDFEDVPFVQQGGLGKVHQLFGEQLPVILDELNEGLAA